MNTTVAPAFVTIGVFSAFDGASPTVGLCPVSFMLESCLFLPVTRLTKPLSSVGEKAGASKSRTGFWQ
ncbi:MAG TPA: hypothetical protein VFC46_06395 [Humisphaera sp.]|nr:hypothetical protein [Humisphaera sp.]